MLSGKVVQDLSHWRPEPIRKFRLALLATHHLSIRHTSLSAGVHSQVALLHELVLMDWYMSKKGKYYSRSVVPQRPHIYCYDRYAWLAIPPSVFHKPFHSGLDV